MYCKNCRAKDPSEFYTNKSNQGTCKKCQRERIRQWKKDHPKEVKAHQEKRRAEGKLTQGHRRRKYGLTEEQFLSMLIAQEGICACCFGPPGSTGWYVDHDHATGKVRGIVCQNCNAMLGHAHDDPERLQRGIDYLKRLTTVQSFAG